MSEIGVVIPFWLYRPDLEALEVAEEADRLGYKRLWIGEMVTFDAFALATAIGMRTRSTTARVPITSLSSRAPRKTPREVPSSLR